MINNQTEIVVLNSIITTMKNSLERLNNSAFDQAEEIIANYWIGQLSLPGVRIERKKRRNNK